LHLAAGGGSVSDWRYTHTQAHKLSPQRGDGIHPFFPSLIALVN
jgi:hypothetical protein